MPDMFTDLIMPNRHAYLVSGTGSESFRMTTCSYCGPTQAGVVARSSGDRNFWLRCSNCGRAIVEVDHLVSPESKPLSTPLGLPARELAAWEEVRDCLRVHASTAAVMLCRKLLLHVAVTHGLAEKDGRGRGPGFAEAIEHLKIEGLITPKMTPWVERIKDVGNEANHELVPISADLSLDVGRFTEQLLRLTYEMDALMEKRPPLAVGSSQAFSDSATEIRFEDSGEWVA